MEIVLREDELTDGSFVYSVIVRQDDESVKLDCRDLQDAIGLYRRLEKCINAPVNNGMILQETRGRFRV